MHEDAGATGGLGHTRARATGAPTVLNFEGAFIMMGNFPTVEDSYTDALIPPHVDSRVTMAGLPHKEQLDPAVS